MRKNLKKLLVLFLAVTLIFCSGCGTTSLQPEDEAQSDSNNEASQGEKGNNEVEQAQEVAVEDDAGNEKDRSVDIAYPEDTITIVCSWAAGGQADVACRLLADLLAEELGTSIIVENVTGTGGDRLRRLNIWMRLQMVIHCCILPMLFVSLPQGWPKYLMIQRK